MERGITFAVRPMQLRKNLPAVIEDAEWNLSLRLRWLAKRLWEDVEADRSRFEDDYRRNRAHQRGERALPASTSDPWFRPAGLYRNLAAIGNGAAFRRGRDFAAWVGVVPRQYSTGGKQKLFGISKRGNIIECPESDSPLRGRIHLRRQSFRSTSNLWQSGGDHTLWPIDLGY